jgi:hypothetical protein
MTDHPTPTNKDSGSGEEPREQIRTLLTEYRVPKYREDEPWVQQYVEKFERFMQRQVLLKAIDELEDLNDWDSAKVHKYIAPRIKELTQQLNDMEEK